MQLKQVISKIATLDNKKCSSAEFLAVKEVHAKRAEFSKLMATKQKLLERTKMLAESFDPNEKIKIDDVPGMDRIKLLELDVEKMKLKLNEAVNINHNFNDMMDVLNKEQL